MSTHQFNGGKNERSGAQNHLILAAGKAWLVKFIPSLSLLCLAGLLLTTVLESSSLAMSADETAARWAFSRDDDRNFDNYPDGWKRTFDRLHPRYLKMEIVPHAVDNELSLRTLDALVLEGWLKARGWTTRLPFGPVFVTSKPTLLPTLQLLPHLMPPLPPSLSDAISNRYLRMEINGGGFLVSSPVMPIDLDYSYRVQARIRTQDVVHNFASIEMVFADEKGQPIEVISTERFRGTKNWLSTEIGPRSAPRRASMMWLNFRYEPDERSDLTGWVGFDDIVVTRFPRIRVETDNPLAIYPVNSQPKIRCVVSGINVDGKAIDFRMLDSEEQLVQAVTVPLSAISEQDNEGGFRKQLVLNGSEIGGIANWELPALDPGFYRVQVTLSGVEDRDFLVEQSLGILSDLPESPGPFGWSITGTSKNIVPSREIPDWLEACHVQVLKYSCWIEPRDLAAADELVWLSSRLQERRIEMVGVLDTPPQKILTELSAQANDPAAILFRDKSLWQPALEPVMTRLTSGITWWQLGKDRDYSFLGRPQLKEAIDEIRVGLQGFGQPIEIAMNWPWLERQLPDEQTSWHTVILSERTPMTAAEIDAYFEEDLNASSGIEGTSDETTSPDEATADSGKQAEADSASKVESSLELVTESSTNGMFKKVAFRVDSLNKSIADEAVATTTSQQRPWIILEPLNRYQYSRSDRILDLVTRMMAVRRQHIPGAFVSEPFNPELGFLRPDGSPDEMLLPWRTAAALLARMHPVGSLELPGESQNTVLADGDSAMMVVWSDRERVETLYLGENVRHIDAFGRELPIEQVTLRGFDAQKFRVTSEPSYLINMDRTAALWRLGVKLDRNRIDSLLEREQVVNLIYQNPSSDAINGGVRVETPDTWNVSGEYRPISAEPYRERTEPITIMLRGDATIGRELIAIDFRLEGERRRQFTVWRPLDVGPEDITLEVTTRLSEDGQLVVRQELTNSARTVKRFDCYVYAPGQRRQRRSITVEAGQTMVQEFYLPNGASLIDQNLLLRAEQQGGDRTLNYRFKAAR